MKKSIAILSILSILSCNNDDDKECKCNVSYSIGDSPERYSYQGVIMDCNTREPITNLDEELPEGYTNLSFNSCNFDK